jgi:hypothetical protein
LPGFAVIYSEISKGFLEMGILKFESYLVSQPVWSPDFRLRSREKSLHVGSFCGSTFP